jgi:16S rRNA (uracil1498-N3)-methyltransferase
MTHRVEAKRVKLDRLRKASIEASEQCERVTVPTVTEPIDLKELITSWSNDRALILCDETGGGPLVEALQSLSPAQPIAFITGPEGGFTPEEVTNILHT